MTARNGRTGRRVVGATESVVLDAAPDGTRRLAEGTLVEASVRARLLGIPLLKLDATIALVPATWSGRAATRRPPGTSGRVARADRHRSPATGKSLADAVRTINEASDLLAEVHRNGS
jgi:hypothetical protein